MTRLFRHVTILLAAMVLGAPVAHAAPDPHIPDPFNGYCPGGGAGNAFEGYCDGVKYPDGSYWHKLAFGVGTAVPWMMPGQSAPVNPWLQCVIDPDGGIPQPAPRGGCGGAVK